MLATDQLTEFLSAVADRPAGPAAHHAAVECAARALDADVAVLMIDGGVVAAIGLPADEVPAYTLAEIAVGRRATLELGDGRYAVTFATISGTSPGVLVLGRVSSPFTAEEVCLLRGMARVLELSLQSLHVIESERRYAEENGRLLGYLDHGRRVFEELGTVQRAIGRRTPVPQVFDMVVTAVRDLLGVDMVTINLVERDDPSRVGIVAATGVPAEVAAKLRHVPLAAGGVSGLAILGDELVAIEDYTTSPIALSPMTAARLKSIMAAPLHENGQTAGSIAVGSFTSKRDWDKPAREILQAFADHLSLALTDARTQEAMSQAFLDALTGLATRALFQTRMEEALSPAGLGGAVLFVDLDRFKVVNDSLGHAAGDALLTGVATRIQACLREGDTAARLGGDEFAVLLPGLHSADEAMPIAERILAALREPFDLLGAETFISSSIGVAFSAPGEHAGSVLMVHADLAMYQAKKLGKDRYEVFEPTMQEAFQAHIALEADLRRAVLRHEFELRYQPIVHLQTNEITGVEALIRWMHPERGIVPPMDFIPLAEETGMIVPIGEWVLREATSRVAEWNARRPGPPLSVSVNLSAVQLEQAALIQVVDSALTDAGLPPAQLVLELTESLLVDHRPTTLQRLEGLKALGVRLAIDDFGTGYSSLAYLRRFPVDIIKIDKSFVDDVVDEPTAAALTHGIIQLGRALQLSTVAEGIEHAGQLTSLAGGNCEMGQGYYFAEPLTGTALSDLLFPRPDPGLSSHPSFNRLPLF
ncbi:putative bifunctional diguanylate cyclase/phosphodiesterase [Paractinoplanes lichenicola]|uniref:EAL domain-containing protein n=1 Tax=Paractinoplanes lichenicola TaxID=2802976 RepID=A0ABS1VS47_9ACTN|nr:EAL domain-containing protein [Actinoplanes lichenicola]MBL7257361.1 EAL domain-containing protein [Actinoplanes lichenicola]